VALALKVCMCVSMDANVPVFMPYTEERNTETKDVSLQTFGTDPRYVRILIRLIEMQTWIFVQKFPLIRQRLLVTE